MAGLVPAIHVLQYICMAGGYIYFMTNRPNGILYVGVTNDPVRRVFGHRSGFVARLYQAVWLKKTRLLRKVRDNPGCDPA
jgi:putative endonuclease